MGITGITLFTLCIAACVLLFLVPIVVVPLWAARHGAAHGGRPGWLVYVLQVVSLVLLPVVFVFTVFVGVNREEQWYESWNDVLGQDSVTTATHNYGAASATSAGQPITLPHQSVTAEQREISAIPGFGQQIAQANQSAARKRGLYVEGNIAGTESKVTANVGIWLPPQYFSQPDRAFPVVEAFSGIPGAPKDYMSIARIDSSIRLLSAQNKVAQTILVIPEAFSGSYDSECVDATQGSSPQRMETWVARDIPTFIKEHFRARTDPRAWATMGYSAGGFCAAMLTTLHPRQFPHAVVLSGYFTPIYEEGQQWRPSGDRRYDLPAVLRADRPAVDLWVYAGFDDPYTTPSLKKLQPAIHAPTTLTTVISQAGGHRWATWMPGFKLGLEHLAQVDSFFAAGATPHKPFTFKH